MCICVYLYVYVCVCMRVITLMTHPHPSGNTPADTTTPGSAKSKGPHKKGPSDIGAGIVRIVKYAAIEKNDKDLWTPIILFSFARRECELYSRILSKEVDLTTEEEKGYIEQVFTNATQYVVVGVRKVVVVGVPLRDMRVYGCL